MHRHLPLAVLGSLPSHCEGACSDLLHDERVKPLVPPVYPTGQPANPRSRALQLSGSRKKQMHD